MRKERGRVVIQVGEDRAASGRQVGMHTHITHTMHALTMTHNSQRRNTHQERTLHTLTHTGTHHIHILSCCLLKGRQEHSS